MLGCRTARTVSSARFFFRSVRTYMSIENVSGLSSRSVRTLITSVTSEWKRLRSFRTLAFLMSLLAIDMQVLTDLKRKVLVDANVLTHRSAGACPPRCLTVARDRPSHYDSRGLHRRAGDRPPRALGPNVYFRINILPVAMNSPAVSV